MELGFLYKCQMKELTYFSNSIIHAMYDSGNSMEE
jgi:hypothetical protein